MTEIKLLDYAAKAAGLGRTGFGNDGFGYYPDGTQDFTPWNPLNDDGDALRLAVKLELSIVISMEQCRARNATYTGWMNEQAGHDCCAATRRAIVRAAAEIGRAMP